MDLLKFSGCNILVIGDLIIDEYIWGEVERISPEAPVQVVSVKSEGYTLGGAGNVVNNLRSLGAGVSVMGVIGSGSHGDLMLKKFADLGVDTGAVIREKDRPTTRKTRVIAASQQVLRIDHETRREISAQTFLKLTDDLEAGIAAADMVLISDYGKGVVTPALFSRIIEIARGLGKRTVADPKGIHFDKYNGVTLLTPNLKEAALAAGIEMITPATPIEAGERLLKTLKIENLLITCGKDGMVLFEKGEEPFQIRAEARQVFDVSGAGDTVLAVLGLALAAGASLRSAAGVANTAAGIVVGKVGTATVSPKELADAINPPDDAAARKHKSLSELAEIVGELQKQGKKIVLTNGCFDLLHAGHIRLFQASRQLGDVLIVALDDDASVKKLKGAGRPVLLAQERVRILSALDSIDYVVVFADAELPRLIESLRPDILTKGSNYEAAEVFGHDLVEKHGGRVALVKVTEEISSSRIIDAIKKGG
ncbi:MAG: D-glycero-beta-D-manno-heptose-7-phosphate kinase [Desulfobacterales bacterium]|nr:D-glycero-beta-D-manno-heptose-7-phosphate kinase [Desulfobacterales bacterium]